MNTVSHALAIAIAIGICPALQADHHLKPVDLSGVWHVKASTDEGTREITWTFKKDGDKFTGLHVDQESGDERNLDRIAVKEKKVALEIDIEMDGNKGVIKVEAEEKAAGKLVGEWSIIGDDGTEYMSGDMSAAKEVAFSGEWHTTSILPDGTTYETVLQLKGKNSALTGLFEGDANETEVDKISVSDNGLKLEFDFEMNGNEINVVIKANPKGDNKLVGNWVVVGDDGSENAEGEWSAVRKSKGLAGTWAVVAAVPDNADYHGTLTLTAKDGKYAGTSKGSNSEARKLKTVSVDGKKLEFSIPFEQGGNSGTITVVAKQKEDGSLEGEWTLADNDDNEVTSDAWKATRK